MNKPNSEVIRSFDPRYFNWSDGREEHGSRYEMRIRIYREGLIFLTSLAAKKFVEYASMTEGGFYRAKIGIAKRAIAIKPLPPEENGYRVRPSKAGGLVIYCKKLVDSLESTFGWELPVVIVATWDKQNKMLVGKL